MRAVRIRGRRASRARRPLGLKPAVKESAQALAGGVVSGLVITGVVSSGWGAVPPGWLMGYAFVGAATLGAAVRGAMEARRRRSEARAIREMQIRLEGAEKSRTQALGLVEQMVASLEQYRTANVVLKRQIDEVSASTGDAAGRLVDQTNRVDGTIRELITGLEGALADAAGRDRESGGKRAAVRETIAEMRRYIESRRHEMAADRERVGAVRRRAEDLSRLASLVEDLADRTKVLAINASIEAARAGGHGRAFAVVADEVHRLAQQSALAAVRITDGLEAVRKAIDEQFAPKLDPAREQEERGLLERFADALSEIDARSGRSAQIHRAVLEQAGEHGRRVADTVMETLAGLQFQDVVRQRLEQVVEALDRMARHTEEVLACVRDSQGRFPEPLRAEDLASAYRMNPQRVAHAKALGQEIAPEEGPPVELF